MTYLAIHGTIVETLRSYFHDEEVGIAPGHPIHDGCWVCNELADKIIESPAGLLLTLEGFDVAARTFERRFFGGPTRDMVLGWFAEARAGMERPSQEQACLSHSTTEETK